MAKILIADDDAGVRQFLQAVLEEAGHELGFANDGEQAIEFFRRGSFDLAIVDLIMPKRNGVIAIHEIIDHDPGAKIIAISADITGQLDLAREAGALALLPKPMTADDLLGAIALLLRRSTGWQGVRE